MNLGFRKCTVASYSLEFSFLFIGSPLGYSGKLQSLKRKHDSSSSSVPEVVPNRGAIVKKQGKQHGN